MRKILLFPALLLICSSAIAGSDDNVTSAPQVGGMFPHFNGGALNQSVSADLRLIAKTYLSYKDAGFVPTDSTTYSYGANRGSVPNPDNLNNDDHILFDESVNYKFNASIWGYENNKQRVQYFTGKKVDQLIYKNWHPSDATWKNAERYLYKYDNNGKMTSSVLQLWYGTLWTQDMVSTLSYDNSNNVVNMNSTTYAVDFVYDQNNNLVRIEDKVWSSGGLVSNQRKNYLYVGNDVVEYTLEVWDNSSWTKISKWKYAYDAMGNVISNTEQKWDGITWVNVKQNLYYYDSDNNKTEDIEMTWDNNSVSFVNNRREVIKYNNKSLPEVVTDFSWNNGWVHKSGDISIHYYYEQYDPTSVDELITDADMVVYPVPANSNLNINLKWDQPQDFNLVLTDMYGRTIFFQHEDTKVAYHRSIPVSDLPTGNYVLAVSGSNGIISQKIAIRH
ncbi:MAG: T9SS type A sorting domain-containing protein [Chitinophagales bacterium]|nr:T9SS type A sorting domain-containing protein [Chitinophagales bacterium]